VGVGVHAGERGCRAVAPPRLSAWVDLPLRKPACLDARTLNLWPCAHHGGMPMAQPHALHDAHPQQAGRRAPRMAVARARPQRRRQQGQGEQQLQGRGRAQRRQLVGRGRRRGARAAAAKRALMKRTTWPWRGRTWRWPGPSSSRWMGWWAKCDKGWWAGGLVG